MKKQYISPAMEQLQLQPMSVIQVSLPSSPGTPGVKSAPERFMLMDEEEAILEEEELW
ncbi:MAG: hypothetical protein J6M19_03385 [Bacteroidaceae bacterium]|nr:hypothetical protein [Bacteroidaceae bacterium]